MPRRKLKIGLVINPVAGIGGPAALKGSDGTDAVEKARAAGAKSQSLDRVSVVFSHLQDLNEQFEIISAPGQCRHNAITRSGNGEVKGQAVASLTLPLAQTKTPTRNPRRRRLQWVRSTLLYRSSDRQLCAICRHSCNSS